VVNRGLSAIAQAEFFSKYGLLTQEADFVATSSWATCCHNSMHFKFAVQPRGLHSSSQHLYLFLWFFWSQLSHCPTPKSKHFTFPQPKPNQTTISQPITIHYIQPKRITVLQPESEPKCITVHQPKPKPKRAAIWEPEPRIKRSSKPKRITIS